MTLLPSLRTLHFLLTYIVQIGGLLTYLIVSCFIMCGCCLLDIYPFQKGSRMSESEREGRWGGLCHIREEGRMGSCLLVNCMGEG